MYPVKDLVCFLRNIVGFYPKHRWFFLKIVGISSKHCEFLRNLLVPQALLVSSKHYWFLQSIIGLFKILLVSSKIVSFFKHCEFLQILLVSSKLLISLPNIVGFYKKFFAIPSIFWFAISSKDELIFLQNFGSIFLQILVPSKF